MSNSSTPYDDSFRTLLTDCSRLIIPLVNEIFNETHPDNSEVELFQNEFFITAGDDQKRITDSNFSIGKHSRYHIECQSSPDGTIIIRVFEYATQIAISTAVSESNETSFTLPKSGILYLRSNSNTMREHTISITAPNGDVLSYKVPALVMQDYTLEKIIDRKLWFLIPFYFFNFDLQEMDALPAKIAEMKELYRNLWDKLDSLVDQEKISEFEKCAIKAMCDKVASSLADNFSNVKEGVEDIMGGQILDYEAKRIARETEKRTEIKANINAVVNMFSIGVSEEQIKKCYPDQFEEGKALYLEQCDELKEM